MLPVQNKQHVAAGHGRCCYAVADAAVAAAAGAAAVAAAVVVACVNCLPMKWYST